MAGRRLPPLGDPFWAKDATGSTGFEALVRRCKDGRRTIEAMEEFVRTRSRLEDEYGKSLLKLAKTGVVKDEFGTLRAAWDRQRSQTEKVGQLHVDLSMALGELATRIHQYVPSLRDQSRKAVELSKKYQASRAALEKKRSSWDSRRSKSKEESSSSPCATSSSAVACDDESAYASIDAIDSGRGGGNEGEQGEGQSILDAACQLFEQMEMERCDFVRKTLWTVTNCDSLTCVERDLANEQVRSALERCSPDGDFKLFINRRRPSESVIPDDALSSTSEPSCSPSASDPNNRFAATKPTASEPNDRSVATKPLSPVATSSGLMMSDMKHRQLLQQLHEQLAAKVASSAGSRTTASGQPGEAAAAGQQAVATVTSTTAATAVPKSSEAQSLLMLPAYRGPAEQTTAAASSSPQAERNRRPQPSTRPVYEEVDLNLYFTLEPTKQQQSPPPLPPPLSSVAAVQPPATQVQPSVDCSAPRALYAVVNIDNRSGLFDQVEASATEQEREEPPHSRHVAPDQEPSPPRPPLPAGQPATALVDAATDFEAIDDDPAVACAETAPSTDGD